MAAAALVIQPDGTVADVHVTPGSIGNHLGCRIADVVALTRRLDMWVGDDSVSTPIPSNQRPPFGCCLLIWSEPK